MRGQQVGMAAVDLGAGREQKGDQIDHAVGMMVHFKVGDQVSAGQPLITLHANDRDRLGRSLQRLENTVVLSERPTAPLPAFYDMISGDNVPSEVNETSNH